MRYAPGGSSPPVGLGPTRQLPKLPERNPPRRQEKDQMLQRRKDVVPRGVDSINGLSRQLHRAAFYDNFREIPITFHQHWAYKMTHVAEKHKETNKKANIDEF